MTLLKIRGGKNRWWWEDCFSHYCWLNANIHTTATTTITSRTSHNIKTPSLISWKDCRHSSQGKKEGCWSSVVSLSCCNWVCSLDFGLCFVTAHEILLESMGDTATVMPNLKVSAVHFRQHNAQNANEPKKWCLRFFAPWFVVQYFPCFQSKLSCRDTTSKII